METERLESDSRIAPPRSKKRKVLRCLLANWFMLSTIVAVAVGFGVGFALQSKGLSVTAKTWIGVPGKVYIRLLTLTILPMIASSIISVLGNLNPKENGKTSMFALTYILSINVISAIIGVAYAFIIKPGAIQTSSSNETGGSTSSGGGNQISYVFRNLILNIFPDNIIGVALFQAGSNFSAPQTGAGGEISYPDLMLPGTNMIGVLFCSVVFGIAANKAQESGRAFKQFFSSLGDVTMLLMQKLLLITPVGVFFMVVESLATTDNLVDTLIKLGAYVGLNFVGQITHLLCCMMFVGILCKNPLRILRYAANMYSVSFATTSAVVAIPQGFEACDRYGIPKSISRFVLPFAGTMKSDASAVFIASACIFVAQVDKIALDAGQIVIIIILSFAYVSALPNIPSASMVAVITILSSIGINSKTTSLLYAVEFINDRLRSGNVALSHLYCAAFTYHASHRGSKGMPEEDDEGFGEQVGDESGSSMDRKLSESIAKE